MGTKVLGSLACGKNASDRSIDARRNIFKKYQTNLYFPKYFKNNLNIVFHNFLTIIFMYFGFK